MNIIFVEKMNISRVFFKKEYSLNCLLVLAPKNQSQNRIKEFSYLRI